MRGLGAQFVTCLCRYATGVFGSPNNCRLQKESRLVAAWVAEGATVGYLEQPQLRRSRQGG
jgi:hypothetical protein